MKVHPGHAEWKAVEQHLDRLLDMDESEWEGYLSQLEGDEPTVVAALREMMADRRNLEAQGFLETSLVKPADQERGDRSSRRRGYKRPTSARQDQVEDASRRARSAQSASSLWCGRTGLRRRRATGRSRRLRCLAGAR